MEIYCTSVDLSKKIDIKHAQLSRIIVRLLTDLAKVDHCFTDNFKCVSRVGSYRGQDFTVYDMTRGFFLVLCSRIKKTKSLSIILSSVSELFEAESIISERDDGAQLDLYKGLFMLNLELSKVGEKAQQESIFKQFIISNFEKLFPYYNFKGSEVGINDGDRVDILAEEKMTKRPVIMELKVSPISAHKQLRSYNFNFNNEAILVNLTPVDVPAKKHVDGIIYKTVTMRGDR